MRTTRLVLAFALLVSCAAASAGEGIAEVTPLFTQDRDNYFVTGLPNPFDELTRPRIRFQLSVKYNLAPQRAGWGLFFGFTQKSIWDLWDWEGSAPFEDSNYNPSLFWAWRPGGFLKALEPSPGLHLLGLRLAIEHESNGQAGAISRGWNRLSGSVRLGHYREVTGSGEIRFVHVIGEVKGWYPQVEGRDAAGGGNPDLVKYYGYGQASLEWGYDVPVSAAGAAEPHYQRLVGVGVLGRIGEKYDRGYLEAWARWRPRWFGWLGASFFMQFVTGYGETLLRYDVRQAPTLRFGVALDDLLSTESAATGAH